MRLMQIVRKPRELWSRFVKWRNFHSRFGLALVVGYISTGRSQWQWRWSNGIALPWGSNEPHKFSVFKLTRHVQLTLVRFYAYREPITNEPDGLSKQVRK